MKKFNKNISFSIILALAMIAVAKFASSSTDLVHANVTSDKINICNSGVDISTQEQAINGGAIYAVKFRIENKSNQTKVIKTREDRCRCPEGDGHLFNTPRSRGTQAEIDKGYPAGADVTLCKDNPNDPFCDQYKICVGKYPQDKGVDANSRSCEVVENSVIEIPAGGVKEVIIRSDQMKDSHNKVCGSYQLDLSLYSIENKDGSQKCDASNGLAWNDPSNGHLSGGLYKTGYSCEKSDNPVCVLNSEPANIGQSRPVTVTFDASQSTGDIKEYIWKLDGEVIPGVSLDPEISKTFSDNSNHKVELQVKDATGNLSQICSKDITGQVTNCIIKSTPENLTSSSLPFTAKFEDLSGMVDGSNEYTREWLVDGIVYSDAKEFSHTFTALGNHIVKLVIKDSNGRVVAECEKTVNLSIQNTPIFSATPWVTHVSQVRNKYFATITALNATVEDWIVTNAEIISENTDGVLISASAGVCPTLKAKVNGVELSVSLACL